MKKLTIIVLVTMAALTGCAHWHHHGFRGCHPHYYHGGFWGHGGRHFWPGFIGGVVGGAVVSAIAPSPTTVVYPTVVQPAVQPVYVQGTTPQVISPQVITVPYQEPAVVYVENGNTVVHTRAGITPSGRYYNPRVVEYGRGRQTTYHVKSPPPVIVEETVQQQPRVIQRTVTETEVVQE
jgi:hypothetical protein